MRSIVVIPAYNEARTIRDIVQRTLRQCDRVIVVDDGSADGTSAMLDGLPVDVIVHEENRGKAAALWNGFVRALEAGADIVVTLDGDGQHRPEDIRSLLSVARAFPHYLIIGARTHGREQYPRVRYYANRVADFCLSWAAGHPIVDSQCGQRAYPAALLRRVDVRHDGESGFTLESEILICAARLGYKTVAVPIPALFDRASRPSHFRPVRDVARIGRMLTRELLAARMYPAGLWRALRHDPVVIETIAVSSDDSARVSRHDAIA